MTNPADERPHPGGVLDRLRRLLGHRTVRPIPRAPRPGYHSAHVEPGPPAARRGERVPARRSPAPLLAEALSRAGSDGRSEAGSREQSEAPTRIDWRNRHALSSTTRTMVLGQLADIDRTLRTAEAPRITAADLALSPEVVPGAAVLTRVSCDGPPQHPYVHGRFSDEAGQTVQVDLHTGALRTISRRLRLRQVWGS